MEENGEQGRWRWAARKRKKPGGNGKRRCTESCPLSPHLYFMAKLFWQKNNSISASVQVIVRVLSRDMLSVGKRRVFFFFTFGQIRMPSIKSNLIFLRAIVFFPRPFGALIAPNLNVTANENEINEHSVEAETKPSSC